MLPDYPEQKGVLRQRLDARLHLQIRQLRGFLGEARTRVMHEGDCLVVIRDDGTVDRSELTEAHAEFQVDRRDVEGLAPEKILEKYQEMAKKIAGAQEESAFAEINRVVAATGNVIDAQGRGFTAELWLEALEAYPLEFGRDNRPRFPTVIVHPDVEERVRKELDRIENEPELLERMARLVERKHAEWRSRESNRRLVE